MAAQIPQEIASALEGLESVKKALVFIADQLTRIAEGAQQAKNDAAAAKRLAEDTAAAVGEMSPHDLPALAVLVADLSKKANVVGSYDPNTGNGIVTELHDIMTRFGWGGRQDIETAAAKIVVNGKQR